MGSASVIHQMAISTATAAVSLALWATSAGITAKTTRAMTSPAASPIHRLRFRLGSSGAARSPGDFCSISSQVEAGAPNRATWSLLSVLCVKVPHPLHLTVCPSPDQSSPLDHKT